MKIFLKEHISLIVLYIVNFFILGILYFFIDGFSNFVDILYFIFLSFFLLGVYLLYKYYNNAALYKKFQSKSNNIDEPIDNLGISPIAKNVTRILDEQYELYKVELQKHISRQNENLIFINQWVHQMKTPLSIIQLTLEENAHEEYASKMRIEADRIDRGLNLALYMSRLDSFEYDFNIQKINLKEIVLNVINDLKRYFIVQKVYPEVFISECFVYSDKKWINFVLNQIIVNATKYSFKGKKIFISDFIDTNGVILSVKDSGVGIPKKDIKRVFDAFYTGENGRKYGESTGMGLYIVDKVCKNLNHEIKIISEVGVGTIVSLKFDNYKNN